MKIFASFVSFYYEILSNFTFKKVYYKITGSCKKCSKCCRYLYCKDLSGELEFKFLQFIYKDYRNFKIIGKDEKGNYILSCTHIQKNNLCPIYKNRPKVCKNYPKKKIKAKVQLHKGCGYQATPEKAFKDFL